MKIMKKYNITSKKIQQNKQPVDNRHLGAQENVAQQQKMMKHELKEHRNELEKENESNK